MTLDKERVINVLSKFNYEIGLSVFGDEFDSQNNSYVDLYEDELNKRQLELSSIIIKAAQVGIITPDTIKSLIFAVHWDFIKDDDKYNDKLLKAVSERITEQLKQSF